MNLDFTTRLYIEVYTSSNDLKRSIHKKDAKYRSRLWGKTSRKFLRGVCIRTAKKLKGPAVKVPNA